DRALPVPRAAAVRQLRPPARPAPIPAVDGPAEGQSVRHPRCRVANHPPPLADGTGGPGPWHAATAWPGEGAWEPHGARAEPPGAGVRIRPRRDDGVAHRARLRPEPPWRRLGRAPPVGCGPGPADADRIRRR